MLFSLPKYICNSLGWLVKSWSQTTIELNYSFTYSFRIGTIFPIFLCFECWKAMCVQTGNYPLPCECATTLNKDLFTASLVSQNGQSGSINASHTSNNTRDFFHSQIPMSLGISSKPLAEDFIFMNQQCHLFEFKRFLSGFIKHFTKTYTEPLNVEKLHQIGQYAFVGRLGNPVPF